MPQPAAVRPGPVCLDLSPPLLHRTVFDAVQQRLTEQWSHRTTTRIRTRGLLAGLLFDDAGHRMILTYFQSGPRSASLLRLCALHPGSKRMHAGRLCDTRACVRDSEATISKAVIANTDTDDPLSNDTLSRETIERSVTRIEVRKKQWRSLSGPAKTNIKGSSAPTIRIRLNTAPSPRASSSGPGRSHQSPSERSCCRRIRQSIAPPAHEGRNARRQGLRH